ncbi:MAG: hypothetical protein ABWX62_04100, partial [Microterricola sp.]
SNDIFRACGTSFLGPATTAWNPASGAKYRAQDSNGSSCSGTTFALSGYPAYSPLVGMPATNGQLKTEVRKDLTATTVPRPGCLYTGPTTITLASNGKMTVRSPWTLATQVVGDPATGGDMLGPCGTVAALRSAAGATIDVPTNNVVYVQGVPGTIGNPNYWAPTALPPGLTCTGATGSSGSGNGIGYPSTNEKAPADSTSGTKAYGCRNGDVFIKGDVNGELTVAAENYVYVTGDIKYVDSQDDMLGLVGNGAVYVWNPIDSSNNTLLSNSGRRIDAAILSVAHSFQVQNPGYGGSRGVLNVNGAIAQKFRGLVIGNGNGYTKNYVYDPRFKYTAPPKFLSPVTTTYGVNVWVETAPALNVNGSYR